MKDNNTMRHVFAMHGRGIRELYKIAPQFFSVLALKSLFTAITPYITVFFSAQILKELAMFRRAEILWQWVAAAVLCSGIVAIIKAILQRHYQTMLRDLYERKDILFIHKMFSMDYAELDKQETHDLRAQIQQNENWSGRGLMKVVNSTERALSSIVGIFAGISLTIRLFTSRIPESAGSLAILNHPLFILLFAAVIIGISLLAGKLSAIAIRCWSDCAEQATLGNRLFGHFGFIGLDKQRSVDIRMNAQQNLVSAYWSTNSFFGAKGPIGQKARGKMGIYSGLGVCVSTLITGFIYLFTCLKALGGAIDVGSIMQYVGAASAMAVNVDELITLIAVMETNTPYLDKTFEFLDIPNAMYQGSLTTEKRMDRQYEVEFKDVSFKYPGSSTWALRHVSITFKVGQRLAIVGENGSGKTTFIKLLCRLYDPQEGQILLNGIDIRKYRYDEYMNLFSVVFQDFQLLAQSIGENVAGSRHYDEVKVLQALSDAGFGERLAMMPKGLKTNLYKELDENGVDVSGGEAQKIAIARALYKDAPFIILDEPTAALDPIAEAEIYSKFNEISTDKTAIYISHRLSSCKFCDEIAVFHEGILIQQGTHEKLLEDETGKYHELWQAQAQYYSE